MALHFDGKVVSSSMIGLDIGSSAVRAAEVTKSRTRRGLTLRRFAQVDLPSGAVVDGEVRQPGVVATALRHLWSEGGFGSRNVVLAVSGQRVIVRQAEVPTMSESDFRSALKFQAMDLIPLPVDDALLDFVILPPPPGEPKQDDRMQILLAAAHRSVIDSYLRALREASLRAVALDPAPTALVRATERMSAATGRTVAVVDLGSDLTVIAVCEGGRARFSRILNRGGGDLTERLAKRLTVAPTEAESLKRAAADNGGSGSLSTEDVDPLVSEIEGSLSFFSDQMGAGALEGVLLTGGGARSARLVGQLTRRLPETVSVVDALDGLEYSDLALGAEGGSAASSAGLLAIGAAEWAFDQPARRLSLLPGELAKAAAARRQLFLMAAGVVIVAVGLGALTLSRTHQTATVEKATAAIQATNTAIQARITQLAPLTNVLAAVHTRLTEVTADESNDIAWSSLLQEITDAMPVGTTLTSLNVSDAQGATANASSATSGSLGSVTMAVTAHGTEEQVAIWLRAFALVPGLSSVWVPSGAASAGTVTFTSTAALTTGVPLVNRSASTAVGS